MVLWIDVEDLFHYVLRNPRPSGIQRLSYELYAELHALLGSSVRFCRHDSVANCLRVVSWDSIHALFGALLEPSAEQAQPGPARAAPAAGPGTPQRASLARKLLQRLPLEMRDQLFEGYVAQRKAAAAQLTVVRRGVGALRAAPALLNRFHFRSQRNAQSVGQDIRELAGPGDILGVLGSPWFHPDYDGFIRQATTSPARQGQPMPTALLVYDLIPLLRPEWCDPGLVRVFRRWYRNFAPKVDYLLAISEATARDVERWAAREGLRLKNPVRTIPVGTGFSGPPVAGAPQLPAGLRPGSYVLVVATVEARKNHLLAFRAWRRMLEDMPPEAVPTLVFAGRVGWLVQDLIQQLENCSYLDGKVVLVRDPVDAELVALYQGCRFTLFPSFYEGWGLPVTESLSFGKLCVASDRTSIPEAGGEFCLYIDPENTTGALETIRRACTDDALIAEREQAIRDGFRPVPWRRSAEALASALGMAPG